MYDKSLRMIIMYTSHDNNNFLLTYLLVIFIYQT